MKSKMVLYGIAAVLVTALVVPSFVQAYWPSSGPAYKSLRSPVTGKARVAKVSSLCPVSHNQADPSQSVTYEGKKISFCCALCEEPFLKDPQKYLGQAKGSSSHAASNNLQS